MRPPFRLIALGLLLLAATVWFATRPSASDLLATRHSPPATSPAHAWSWQTEATPPSLPPAGARAAIAAWLALRAPDGAPADFPARVEALRALLTRLSPADFGALLTPLAALTTADDRRLLEIAFVRWAEHDPAAAARWAGSVPDSPGLDPVRLSWTAAREWFALDPQAAAAWACALPDERRAIGFANNLLPLLATNDPSRAMVLATDRGGPFLDAVLGYLFEPLAKADPIAAIQAHGARLWKNGQGFNQHWQLRDALAAWMIRDPAAAIGWISAQPRAPGTDISPLLRILAYGQIDHGALAASLATNPDLPFAAETLGHVLAHWGATSPAQAAAWLETITDRHLRTVFAETAAGGGEVRDPRQSLPLALAMSEGANRTARVSQLLAQWAAADPSAALAWIREQSDPAVLVASSTAQAAILGKIARDEPATALAEWAKLSDPAAKKASLHPIANAWGVTDPGAALQWLIEQDPEIRFDYNLLYAWSRKDPLPALRWAEEHTDLAANYPLLWVLAGSVNDAPPHAEVADLYTHIQDPALRADNLARHLAEWRTKDPAAVRAWLESQTSLTPAETAALLAP